MTTLTKLEETKQEVARIKRNLSDGLERLDKLKEELESLEEIQTQAQRVSLEHWKPRAGDSRFYYVGFDTQVHVMHGDGESYKRNRYANQEAAKAEAAYLARVRAIRQMHFALYPGGWHPTDYPEFWIIWDIHGYTNLYPGVYNKAERPSITEIAFKTKSDCQMVIDQLKKEGLE